MFSKILNLVVLKTVGAILGLIYSFLIIYYFGKSRTVEVFFVSNSLLYIITSLTQSGQLSEIFLPEYTRLKHLFGNEVAHKAFSVVITRLLCWMGVLMVIFLTTANYWAKLMAPSFDLQEQALIASMFRVMLVQFVLVIINSFITTVLNAEKVYGKSESASIINSILNIGSLIILYPYLGIWVLVFSLLIGRIAELILSWILLRKTNFKYYFIFKIDEFNHSQFFSVVKHTFLYVGATQCFYVVFTSMATSFAPGIYAIFSHVQNIIGKIQSILLGPISTVFFSEYSNKKYSQASSEKPAESLLESTIMETLVLMISFICILGPITLELMQSLLYNKSLSLSDMNFSASLFHLLMFNILFSATGGLFRKAVISKGYSKTIYFYWTIIQLSSCLIAYLFMHFAGSLGLLFINPINILLLNSASLYIYIKTQDYKIKIDFRLLTKVLILSLGTYLLIAVARILLLPYSNQWILLMTLFPLGVIIQLISLKLFRVMDMFAKIKTLLKTL